MTGSRIRAKSKMAAVYESIGSAVHVGFFYLFPSQEEIRSTFILG